MKTFKDFLQESSSIAPQGVLTHNGHIFVGVDHGKTPTMSDTISDTVNSHGTEHGFYYEGVGGDVSQPAFGLKTKEDYKGGWDESFQKTVNGYPIQYMTTMFANSAVNHQHKAIVKEAILGNHKTIFASILTGQKNIMGWDFKDKFTEEGLHDFLGKMSDDKVDFRQLSQLPPTEENAKKFIDHGEKLAYPSDWQVSQDPRAALARTSDADRNNYLLQSPAGVYFVGSGHIKQLESSLRDNEEPHTLHGGEDII